MVSRWYEEGLNGSFWRWCQKNYLLMILKTLCETVDLEVWRYTWVSGLPISNVAACFSGPNVDFSSFQPLRSQHSPSKLIFRLYSCPTTIYTLTFVRHSIPHHPTLDTTLLVQLAILFGGNFYKLQLVLRKLLSTVKWSIFCVNFIDVLKVLGWL